ncbi:AraC family transcriptional regulator [Wukongibacter baidiensis]|uniref:AraC family transcriptional regulator n=1 Tax=Wukongibacter baidiensis TaxID=1723361 RepID=UPI003D7F40C8
MKFRPIVVDDSMQELTEHGTPEFPVSMDRQLVSAENCAQVPHWHYEVQIAVVTEGSVVFKTRSNSYNLNVGEGIFINSGCLHEVIATEIPDSVYVCVNFHPKLIYGDVDSIIRRDYVEPLLFSKSLQTVPLTNDSWHSEIIGLLQRLAVIQEEQSYGYELEMKIIINEIWRIMVVNNKELIEENRTITFSQRSRIRALTSFIQKNYAQNISLEDIANVGYVSRGECCRLFKRVENTTPISYLTHVRILQGTKLLATTDLSVTEIAQQVGFGSGSYFAERFKKEMGCSPLQYRKRSSEKMAQNAEEKRSI